MADPASYGNPDRDIDQVYFLSIQWRSQNFYFLFFFEKIVGVGEGVEDYEVGELNHSPIRWKFVIRIVINIWKKVAFDLKVKSELFLNICKWFGVKQLFGVFQFPEFGIFQIFMAKYNFWSHAH